MVTSLGEFKLIVTSGYVKNSEIAIVVGKEGTGKTTFIRLLAGLAKKDEDLEGSLNTLPIKISLKPQLIDCSRSGTVKVILEEEIPDAFTLPQVSSLN